jgi:transcriptional regulator with XRE-family HTH domain
MNPDELSTWRAAHKLTLDELAAQLGVSRMTVWKWERGQHAIPHLLDLALCCLDARPDFMEEKRPTEKTAR